MKLYLVEYSVDYDQSDLVGVFSTIEKAKASVPDADWHPPRPRAEWYMDPAIFPLIDHGMGLTMREVLLDQNVWEESESEASDE